MEACGILCGVRADRLRLRSGTGAVDRGRRIQNHYARDSTACGALCAARKSACKRYGKRTALRVEDHRDFDGGRAHRWRVRWILRAGYGHVPDPAADGACTPLPCRGEWHRKGDQPFHQHRRAHGLSVQRESDFSAWPHGGLFQHCRKLHRHALLCKGRREVREADHPHRAGDLLHKGAHRSAAIAFGRSNRSDGFARVKKVAKGHFFEFSQRLPLADAPGRQTLQ